MASSHLLKKLITSPSFTTFHFRTVATSAFRTTKDLTGSILPLSSPAAVGASFSRLIDKREFHVQVSDHDSDNNCETLKKETSTIILEPRECKKEFKNLEFLMVEDYQRKTNLEVVFSMSFPRLVHSDEDGLCFDMHMPGMDSRHVSVCVEDNTLLCEGTTPDGKPALYLREFDYLPPNKKYTRPAGIKTETQFCPGTGTYIGWMSLPKKMYTQTDVKATMKEGVLRVTFPNLTKEDLEQV